MKLINSEKDNNFGKLKTKLRGTKNIGIETYNL